MQGLQIAFVLLLASAPAVCAQTDPLLKVYELMDSLAAKITKEGEEEAKAFKEYVEWCDDAAANLRNEIKTGEAKQEELEASIAKCNADIAACDSKIEELSASIAEDEKELKDATEVRNKEHKTFAAAEAELVDAIDTLDRATAILRREMEKNPAALVQVDTKNLESVINALGVVINAASFSANDQSKLMALVQQRSSSDDEDMQEPGAPAAAVYKTHSSSIFDVLEDMKEKAESQLSDMRKAEQTSQHNFNMLKQSLEDEIEADTKDMDEEKSLKAATEEEKATAEGDLAETVKELENDREDLKTTTTTCMQVAADHDATVKARTEELTAIATAKKVLKEATGGAQEQTYSFLQMASQAHLQSRTALKNAEVINLVKKLARDHHSSALAQLASRIKAVMAYGNNDDVFAKVKGLISSMIEKLLAEAEADATEKAYCDKEMAETETKKADKEAAIEKLSTQIDSMTAKSAKLKEVVATLQKELAALARAQAELDKVRAEEKAAFDVNSAEMKKGVEGVKLALKVLREYYAKDDKAHSSADGAGSGIIGLLEVCESDFSKGLAEMIAAEESAVNDYERTTKENEIEKATKSQDVKYKTKEAKSLDKDTTEATADRAGVQDELDAVNEYYKGIKARCIAKAETYEERVKRRTAEIAGLKEALSILDGEAMLLQRSSKRTLRGRIQAHA